MVVRTLLFVYALCSSCEIARKPVCYGEQQGLRRATSGRITYRSVGIGVVLIVVPLR